VFSLILDGRFFYHPEDSPPNKKSLERILRDFFDTNFSQKEKS